MAKVDQSQPKRSNLKSAIRVCIFLFFFFIFPAAPYHTTVFDNIDKNLKTPEKISSYEPDKMKFNIIGALKAALKSDHRVKFER